MVRPKKAICPISNDYLTKGKEYEIIKWHDDEYFSIADDDGDIIECVKNGSAHIDSLNWILK